MDVEDVGLYQIFEAQFIPEDVGLIEVLAEGGVNADVVKDSFLLIVDFKNCAPRRFVSMQAS